MQMHFRTAVNLNCDKKKREKEKKNERKIERKKKKSLISS
jgi:hypothetical protein